MYTNKNNSKRFINQLLSFELQHNARLPWFFYNMGNFYQIEQFYNVNQLLNADLFWML